MLAMCKHPSAPSHISSRFGFEVKKLRNCGELDFSPPSLAQVVVVVVVVLTLTRIIKSVVTGQAPVSGAEEYPREKRTQPKVVVLCWM